MGLLSSPEYLQSFVFRVKGDRRKTKGETRKEGVIKARLALELVVTSARQALEMVVTSASLSCSPRETKTFFPVPSCSWTFPDPEFRNCCLYMMVLNNLYFSDLGFSHLLKRREIGSDLESQVFDPSAQEAKAKG